MVSFDDDADAANGSPDESENEDEEMEDANEAEADADQDDDQAGDDEEDEENDDNDNEDDEDEDQPDADSPSRRASQHVRRSPERDRQPTNPALVLTLPSPRHPTVRTTNGASSSTSFIPPTRPEALIAQSYDIVPTMAAPQSTNINCVTATTDMRWVFSGGTDGYVRMYNWVETANGKVPLTVAQKHPFVDSVMKAGSLLTYWENEDPIMTTPFSGHDGEGKWTSPVYSLAVQHQALWLLSGLESGGINLQTCRHQAGTRITTLKEHTSAVSVLALSQDETSLLSGSWDKAIHDWDLQTGQVRRSFKDAGGQIGAIETRPLSDVPVPEVNEEVVYESINGTYSTNNADKPLPNGILANGVSRDGDEDAVGSPSGSLFDDDHGSLFGEDTAAGGGSGNAFGDDEDDLTRALANGLEEGDEDAPGEQQEDTEMGGMGDGGPVQPPLPPESERVPATIDAHTNTDEDAGLPDGQPDIQSENEQQAQQEQQQQPAVQHGIVSLTNGLPHTTDEPLTAPPTNETAADSSSLPPQSNSTFLDAAIDGTLRIWDRRVSNPIATIRPFGGTPPWCTGACWSPDGNFFYAGRRNCTVDEWDVRMLGRKEGKPDRVFRFQQGSGPVYAVRSMPNGRHLVCASQDILRIYDLQHAQSLENGRHRSTVPFTIVPGHRGGVISTIYIDPTCRFMLSAAGNRGWEGFSTEVLLGYEIGVQDAQGVWHK